MSGLPPSVFAAAAVGILGSCWNSGGQAMYSLMGVPGLLAASVPPQVLARQWEAVYNRGKVLGPQVAVLSLLGYAYLAYDRGRRGEPWAGFAASAALSVAIAPFTLLVMAPTNAGLLAAAAGPAKAATSDAAVRELLVRWRALNLFRSVFPLAGAVLGLWTLLG